MSWNSGVYTSICITWDGGRDLLLLQLWRMGGSLWYVISSWHAWALREQRQLCSVSLQTIYTRLSVSHDSITSKAKRYLTVSAHFYSGLVLHQVSWSELQVGYQISMGRPRLKRNHRQEGFPPSWLRLTQSVRANAKLTTGAYGMRS